MEMSHVCICGNASVLYFIIRSCKHAQNPLSLTKYKEECNSTNHLKIKYTRIFSILLQKFDSGMTSELPNVHLQQLFKRNS